MKSNNIIITSLFLTLLLGVRLRQVTWKNSNSNSQTKQKKSSNRIAGTHSYKDNSAELVITISGNSWSGKTMMVTGFGSDYDNQNAQYDNGIVKGNDLYESSGMVKVGYVNGNSLTTSIGGQSVTLSK